MKAALKQGLPPVQAGKHTLKKHQTPEESYMNTHGEGDARTASDRMFYTREDMANIPWRTTFDEQMGNLDSNLMNVMYAQSPIKLAAPDKPENMFKLNSFTAE